MAKSEATRSARQAGAEERSLGRVMAACRSLADNQGQDLVVLDLREQTALFDYFILATGRSGRQLRAMADDLDVLMKREFRDRRLSVDGYNESRWIVLDYGDIVIHLFDAQARNFYRLEDLWADAGRVPLPAAT